MDEDWPDLVVRPGVRSGLTGPPAQRGIRHQRRSLPRLYRAKAAPQRRPALVVDANKRRVTRIIANAKLSQYLARDRAYRELGLVLSTGLGVSTGLVLNSCGHRTMIKNRNGVVWRESDTKFRGEPWPVAAAENDHCGAELV